MPSVIRSYSSLDRRRRLRSHAEAPTCQNGREREGNHGRRNDGVRIPLSNLVGDDVRYEVEERLDVLVSNTRDRSDEVYETYNNFDHHAPVCA